ncbi:hypothetical protein [Candidatus Nitrosocosmicus hydrocola]|uniref:hypothetical protein n=1 Tax=Candidatus Nitrosocosmicus hydrocola TaxID=1826872 RepID=UPI0011E5C5AA|nr:hypothetical protein [Candidatus Nitrosocosmicus hydrocola]
MKRNLFSSGKGSDSSVLLSISIIIFSLIMVSTFAAAYAIPTSNSTIPTSNSTIPTSNSTIPTSNSTIPTTNSSAAIDNQNGTIASFPGSIDSDRRHMPVL